ncbi:MAG: DUF456 domain-containing protein [Bacteroidales bacterium]|nr:DUF456 domain-containing protein [Bacteroidales bacterium]
MTIWIVLAVILAVLGIVGSVVPGLPGPPLGWVGLLFVFIAGKVGGNVLLIWLAVTVAVTALDYIIPAQVTRLAGGHKAASTGALIGLFAGMFLTPVGMVMGTLLGAFLGELLVTDKGLWSAFKAGAGAFVGVLLSTVLKLAVTGVMAWSIVKYSFF